MRLTLPKPIADKLCAIRRKDYKLKPFKSSGPGGAHRNKNATAMRITHIPTGISAEAADSKSLATNKKKAFLKLVNKLIEHFKKDLYAPVYEEKQAIGWADKVRTYHQPRGTVKDHRTGVTADYDKTLDGDLDPFIDAMVKKDDDG